jgi:hypothetical protein
MEAAAVAADPRFSNLLPGSGFADAYRVVCPVRPLTARQAAEAIFDTPPPKWVDALMALRNGITGWFGLKPGVRQAGAAGGSRVGMFPVLAESAEEMLLGLDDRHLDFRLAVAVRPSAGNQQITVTTVVCTHNLLGRVYLAAILPFHRVIVRSMLKRGARCLVDAQV